MIKVQSCVIRLRWPYNGTGVSIKVVKCTGSAIRLPGPASYYLCEAQHTWYLCEMEWGRWSLPHRANWVILNFHHFAMYIFNIWKLECFFQNKYILFGGCFFSSPIVPAIWPKGFLVHWPGLQLCPCIGSTESLTTGQPGKPLGVAF